MKLILLRHGESQWNLENRFTGWKDVSLTNTGIEEATFSGNQLLKANIKISSVYTSLLDRATETANIVTKIINFQKKNIKYDWRLNERHYGALQGLNKSETATKYGEDQVHIWRRSYDIPPPLLENDDQRHPKFNTKFKAINAELPRGESLKNVIDRLKCTKLITIRPQKKKNRRSPKRRPDTLPRESLKARVRIEQKYTMFISLFETDSIGVSITMNPLAIVNL